MSAIGCEAFDPGRSFEASCDVVVCGFGGAGGAAALEARLAGAETVVFERASGPGGSTGMSSCEMYLGGSGGTALQRDLGYDDPTDNMIAYLEASLGAKGDPDKIRVYAENAAAHFDWVEGLGVPYKRAVMLEREVVPLTDESLLFTGNERAHPFPLHAAPVPRGHVPSREGDFGGQMFMEALSKAVKEAGVSIQCDTRVLRLLQDETGRIRGVVIRQDNREKYVEARRGVVLASGGFVMNHDMKRRYMPEIHQWGVPYGNPYDMGDGVQMGLAAGGVAVNMEEAFVSLPLYPPASLTKGLLLNARGERYINEDAYLARLAHATAQQEGQKAYMLIESGDFANPLYLERLDVVGVAETLEELAAETAFPTGALLDTVAYYNRFAPEGRDPKFHKAAEWVKPFVTPPFALIDISFDRQTAVIMPGTVGPLIFTLGGLDTTVDGEVRRFDGSLIAGLYAAGRVSAGLPRTAKGYASGMSVGDATLFGRRAGRAAAAFQP